MTSGTSTCTATFDQAGNTNYTTATRVTETVAATKTAATVSLSNLNQIYDGSAKSATATTTPSGLSGVTITCAQGTTAVSAPTTAGSYSVDASLNNTNYTASDATGTLVIANAPQTITFDLSTLPAKTYGDADFNIGSDASASSGLTVGFSSATTGVCTVSGSTVTIVSAGTCTIGADQVGNTNYNKAPQAQQSLTITRAPLTITASSGAMTYGGTVPSITPKYSGLVNNNTAPATPPACSTTATSSSSVGTYPTTCSGAADPNYSIGSGSYVGGTLTINPASQLISFGPLANHLLGDDPFMVSATGGGSGNPVTFSAGPTGVCAASGTNGQTITLVGVGTCTVIANQAGNANYTAASPVVQSLSAAYPPLYMALALTGSPSGPVTTGSTVTASFVLGNHTAVAQKVAGTTTLTYTGSHGTLRLSWPFTARLGAAQTISQSNKFAVTWWFPRGTYTLSVTAQDGSGDIASRSSSLTVR